MGLKPLTKKWKRETETRTGKTRALNVNPAASGAEAKEGANLPHWHVDISPKRAFSAFTNVCAHVYAWMYSHHECCVCLCKCIAKCARGTCPRDFLSTGHSLNSRAVVTQLIWKSPSWFLTAAILTRLLSEQPWPVWAQRSRSNPAQNFPREWDV